MGEMRHPLFAKVFAANPEHYPFALERQYERILARVARLWATPEMHAYFEDLMIDKRGGRQGFPADVARDIFRLNMAYEALRSTGEVEDLWGQEPEQEANTAAFPVRDVVKALEGNDLSRIAALLDAGMPVDTPLDNGWTPLMVATFNASEETAILLIKRGASVFVTDADGYTPLHWAALNGFEKVVSLLLMRRANVDAPTRYGITPLMQAAGKGHAHVVRHLITHGARVNHQDHEGWSALHKSVSNGHLEVSLLLLSKGGNPRLAHRSGVTPVDIANQSKRPSIQRLFQIV